MRVISTSGEASDSLHYPSQIAFDEKTGKIYVLTFGDPVVVIFDTIGRTLGSIDRSISPQDSLEEVVDLIVHRGFVWLVDNGSGRIRQFTLDGEYFGSFNIRAMAFSMTGFGDYLICSHLLGGDEMIPYNMYTGETPDGYKKKLSKISMALGMFNVFDRMMFISSAPSGTIYTTHLYENRMEKYSSELKRIKRVKLTDEKSKDSKTVKKSADGRIEIFAGTQFAKDICYSYERVFVLWNDEVSPQGDCEGKSNISVFNAELNLQYDMVVEDCLESMVVAGEHLFATTRSPRNAVILYRLRKMQ
ncbi:MAG: hypothetical protein K9N53_07840 [Candidatus Marinimicrobia bacterium]|nr:hypothetical protein [Candidatus Neomarinimicrobiota bacterium]